jgi:small subunit ribosomal protein S1
MSRSARIGQTVEAQVVKLEPDPWLTAAERSPVGATVNGRVRRLESFGAFVEMAPGVEGLAHVSRLALDRRISHPRQVVAIGDEVEMTVVSLDPEKRRIGLSMVGSARRARDASDLAESREAADLLARSNDAKSFGTLGELMAAPRKPKQKG